MSELAKTIERLELWADHLEPHFMTPFIADVLTLISAAKAVNRAVDWLQKAQRYDLQPLGDYQGEGMVHSDSGDYVDADDVDRAIQILQEGDDEGK